jgi:hypothetical protein
MDDYVVADIGGGRIKNHHVDVAVDNSFLQFIV